MESFNAYVGHVQSALPTNPQIFQSFINNTKRAVPYPVRIKYADNYTSDLSEMCQNFAEQAYFSSVFTLPYMLFLSRGLRLACSASEPLSSCIVTSEEVENALGKLGIAKVSGPDVIPPLVLKYCSPAQLDTCIIFLTDCF